MYYLKLLRWKQRYLKIVSIQHDINDNGCLWDVEKGLRWVIMKSDFCIFHNVYILKITLGVIVENYNFSVWEMWMFATLSHVRF